MQRHDRRVAVGHHVDRQFVVAAEQESRRNQLRSLERLDRHGTPRRGGHLAVHLPPHDNHQARIGRIPAGYQLAVAVIGQRVVPAAVDNFMDLIFRQPSEQRALGQYGIHSVRIMFVFRCCQTTGEITYFPDDFQKLARYGSGSTVERPQEHPREKPRPDTRSAERPTRSPFLKRDDIRVSSFRSGRLRARPSLPPDTVPAIPSYRLYPSDRLLPGPERRRLRNRPRPRTVMQYERRPPFPPRVVPKAPA